MLDSALENARHYAAMIGDLEHPGLFLLIIAFFAYMYGKELIEGLREGDGWPDFLDLVRDIFLAIFLAIFFSIAFYWCLTTDRPSEYDPYGM